MAITRQSQIINKGSVIAAAGKLDDVVANLKKAKDGLTNSIKYCNYDTFHTNMGNTFPDKINNEIKVIEEQINAINKLKENVVAEANSIYKNETKQYQEYLKEQEEKKAEE